MNKPLKTHKMVTPRFNFVQLFGILWLAPFFFTLMIICSELYRDFESSDSFDADLWIPLIIAFFLMLISLNFMLKKKWIRYLIAIGFVLFCILIGFILLDSFSGEHDDLLNKTSFILSSFSFTFGVLLLTFNVGTTVEFERQRKESIDYTKALHNAQLNQHYFLKNTINLTVPIGLILIAPAFIFLIILFDEISIGHFNLTNDDDLFLVFLAFSFLICGIGAFLKFKIIRYFPLIIFVLIGIFALSKQGTISFRQLIILVGFAITGITFVAALVAMLFHPIMTHSFESSIKLTEEYDNILDIEL